MKAARSGRAASAAALLALAAGPAPAAAGVEGSPSDEAAALAASQAAIGRELGDYRLTDQYGQPLSFASLRGRPVVLSLVYTSCYHVCSGLTVHLRNVVQVARDAVGPQSFSVVTLGFDAANDTSARMLAYARERRADLPGWRFASADAPTIERLARDVGFTFERSPKGFDHITQTTLIDAGGRVVLQVYGEDFAAPLVVEPLKKLVWGGDVGRMTLDGLANTVRLFCTIYDPATGRYRFDYSLITEIVAGVLALGMAAVGIGFAARRVR